MRIYEPKLLFFMVDIWWKSLTNFFLRKKGKINGMENQLFQKVQFTTPDLFLLCGK